MKSTVVKKSNTGTVAAKLRRWRQKKKQRELIAFRNENEKRRADHVAGASQPKVIYTYKDYRNMLQKLYVTDVKDVSMESRGFEWDAVRKRYVGPRERAMRKQQQYQLPDNVSSSSLPSPELQVQVPNSISVFADNVSSSMSLPLSLPELVLSDTSYNTASPSPPPVASSSPASSPVSDNATLITTDGDYVNEDLLNHVNHINKMEDGYVKKLNRVLRGGGRILGWYNGEQVNKDSLSSLVGSNWLDDGILNYFLKNVCGAIDNKRNGKHNICFFNSFFMQNMFDEKNKNLELRGKYNYNNVRRWGGNAGGIFKYKKVVFPVNTDNKHWTMVMIDMEKKRIHYHDSMIFNDEKKIRGVMQYLMDEHFKVYGQKLPSGWGIVQCTEHNTPMQNDGYSCGVFVCMMSLFVALGKPITTIEEDHIARGRNFIAWCIEEFGNYRKVH